MAGMTGVTRFIVPTVIALAFLVGAWFFIREFNAADQQAVEVFLNGPTIEKCLAGDMEKVKPEKIEPALLLTMANNCSLRIAQQNFATDALLRRVKLVQQIGDGRVMLWMVVVITLSGVVLAGVQLLASYRLATIGRESLNQSMEFTVEKDKVALKSSVTGLFILLISFAFFLVFVQQIYTVTYVDPDATGKMSGGLGAPPVAAGDALGVLPGTPVTGR